MRGELQPRGVRPATRRGEPDSRPERGPSPYTALDRERIVALQHTAGNRAVLRALGGRDLGRAGAVMVQRYRTSASGSLTAILGKVQKKWPKFWFAWKEEQPAPTAQPATAETSVLAEEEEPATAETSVLAEEEEPAPPAIEQFAEFIRGLMHLQDEEPAVGEETGAEGGQAGSVPFLQTVLRDFPPGDAGGVGWRLQCRDPQGEEMRLRPEDVERHQDEPGWSMGLVYYGSGESKEGTSNFRIGINAQPNQTPAVAKRLLPLLALPFVGQFKIYTPESAGGLLDNTIVYYHEDDTTELPHTRELESKLREAELGRLTREEHSGLMEPLAGTRGAAFAVHEAGTAYSKVRSEQIAAALWPLMASKEVGVPELAVLKKALEDAGLRPESPHLAPLA